MENILLHFLKSFEYEMSSNSCISTYIRFSYSYSHPDTSCITSMTNQYLNKVLYKIPFAISSILFFSQYHFCLWPNEFPFQLCGSAPHPSSLQWPLLWRTWLRKCWAQVNKGMSNYYWNLSLLSYIGNLEKANLNRRSERECLVNYKGEKDCVRCEEKLKQYRCTHQKSVGSIWSWLI